MDYLAKPFAPEELLHAVARCAERYRLLQENASLRARASETYQLEQIVGESPKMRELRQLIQTVAPTDARVLILGESGTGKELVAGALHSLSQRAPGQLRPHQLRRHSRNAAGKRTVRPRERRLHRRAQTETRPRRGSRRRHDFLDEIARHEPAAAGQAAALSGRRHLHPRRRHQELRVNVRLIAATNRDIIEAIRAGPVPRGPVPSAERGAVPPAAVARARRRRRCCWPNIS